MIPSLNPNMVQEGLALLTDMLKRQPNVNAILAALLGPIQDLENVAISTVVLRSFSVATGDALDKWGSIVGEPRNGRSDADYRVAIVIRISVNDSNGKAEDLLGIATLAFGVGNFSYAESTTSPAAWELTAVDAAGFPSITRDFRDAKAAGTRGVIIHSEPGSGPHFVFSSISGGGAGRGFGSVSDPSFTSTMTDATGV